MRTNLEASSFVSDCFYWISVDDLKDHSDFNEDFVLYSLDILNRHSLHFTTSVTCSSVETTVDYRQCCFLCRNHTVAGLNQVWLFVNVFVWSRRKQNVEDWTISKRMGLHATGRNFLAVPGAEELTWKICKKFVTKRNLRLQDNLRYYVIIVMTALWYYTLP